MTSQQTRTRQYAAHANGVIYGIGETPDDAIEDAQRNAGNDDDFPVDRMTHALYRAVLECGGNLSFDTVDGVLMTGCAAERLKARRDAKKAARDAANNLTLRPFVEDATKWSRRETAATRKVLDLASERASALQEIERLKARIASIETEREAALAEAKFAERACEGASGRLRTARAAISACDAGNPKYRRAKTTGRVMRVMPDGKNAVPLDDPLGLL